MNRVSFAHGLFMNNRTKGLVRMLYEYLSSVGYKICKKKLEEFLLQWEDKETTLRPEISRFKSHGIWKWEVEDGKRIMNWEKAKNCSRREFCEIPGNYKELSDKHDLEKNKGKELRKQVNQEVKKEVIKKVHRKNLVEGRI